MPPAAPPTASEEAGSLMLQLATAPASASHPRLVLANRPCNVMVGLYFRPYPGCYRHPVYCPTCREAAAFPWQHAPDCVDGLRAQLRWYRAGLPIVALLLLAETVLLAAAWAVLER